MSALEETLAFQIMAAGLPEPEREHLFALPLRRRWRFDFCWPAHMLAVEVEGGLWSRGDSGHKHPLGIERDIHKYNTAVQIGWRVIRVTGKMIESGEALGLLQAMLPQKAA